MRLIYLIVVGAIIAAVVAPFYLKGPGGEPLVTVGDFVDNAPSTSKVYRWQDANGVWQFGDAPPGGAEAEPVELSPNITPIQADWAAQWAAKHPPEQTAEPGVLPQGTDTLPAIGDVYDGAAMQKAEQAAGLIEKRIHEIKGAMDEFAGSR